ncbi:hypothetical protein OG607_38120 [Streptomyces sp. NBC_01537]|uniref:sarcosine oxidase subunit gamma n=1 Tax=Streptomyces sp. NBC_01537 TaxID=2903896 RepID=UPI00386E90AB
MDVSANRTTLELSGPAARQVLEKGCPLNLHPRAFGPGQAVSTTVGPVAVLLWQVDDVPTYRLFPRSSFADYPAVIESVPGEPERVLQPSARVVRSAPGTGPPRPQ